MLLDDTRIDDVASKLKPTLIRQMSQIAHPTSINLGIGQLLFEPDPAIGKVLQNPLPSDFRYPPNAGIPELREAIAKQHGGLALDF